MLGKKMESTISKTIVNLLKILPNNDNEVHFYTPNITEEKPPFSKVRHYFDRVLSSSSSISISISTSESWYFLWTFSALAAYFRSAPFAHSLTRTLIHSFKFSMCFCMDTYCVLIATFCAILYIVPFFVRSFIIHFNRLCTFYWHVN